MTVTDVEATEQVQHIYNVWHALIHISSSDLDFLGGCKE